MFVFLLDHPLRKLILMIVEYVCDAMHGRCIFKFGNESFERTES
jgi:hypothetical protein